MKHWRMQRPRSGSDPIDGIDDALAAARAEYANGRASAAAQLYAAHKLAGEARHQRAIAESSREAARALLAGRDATRSRRMVEATRTALDLARDAEIAHEELRAHADTALDALRRLAQTIAELERDRLRAVALLRHTPRSTPSIEEARHALSILEAERELDAELGHGSE
jgi:hypothetical protein